MPIKDQTLNRQYVTKSRQKSINTLGIDEYRRIQAQKQREYRAKKKALRNPHIQDRKSRTVKIKELLKVRQELKHEKRKKENLIVMYK
jgi:hypothetical protein